MLPLCGKVWLRDVRTYHVQGWLNQIGRRELSRNTLKHVKSVVSAIFTLAKQQDYFQAENPARDTAVNPGAAEPQETYAYSIEEIHTILSMLPEPAATAFAIAAFMGLRHGEIQGLLWEDYRDGEMHISRSIWNGRVTAPKTRKSRAPIPVIKQLSHLPVLADPSHGTGRRDKVAPMARAAIAAGADGLLIEVHPDPESALSDGPQSLTFEMFSELMARLRRLAESLDRRLATAPSQETAASPG